MAYLNNLNNAGAAEAAKRAIKANDQNPKGQPFLITKIDRNLRCFKIIVTKLINEQPELELFEF